MRLSLAIVIAIALVAATAVGVSFAVRGTSSDAQAPPAASSNGSHGSGAAHSADEHEHTVVTGDHPLSQEEAEMIAFMREEEKLAHDVYVVLADAFRLRAFDNLSASESRHMDALGELIEAYGLPDPAAETAPGEFLNDDLQDLYDTLVTDGSVSLSAALEVGIMIEEIDIRDLGQYLEATENPEVSAVFNDLLEGSYRHLSSFERLLLKHGG